MMNRTLKFVATDPKMGMTLDELAMAVAEAKRLEINGSAVALVDLKGVKKIKAIEFAEQETTDV